MRAKRRIRQRAKALRRQLTHAEVILWSRLKARQINGWHFRKQHPVGPFIADFACVKAKLIIEVDGDTHATDTAIAYDNRRTAYLRTMGWQVHRIWNRDIYNNLTAVLDGIYELLPPPTQR